MDSELSRIRASCPLYACRECRTKTLWLHQRWCPLADAAEPTCAQCHYWNAAESVCGHPSHRKDGDAP